MVNNNILEYSLMSLAMKMPSFIKYIISFIYKFLGQSRMI